MPSFLRTLAAEIGSGAIMLFARAVTAPRAIWAGGAPSARQTIYFANHASHGDFVLVWAVLPPRIRQRTRPVAAADYWLRNRLTRFIGRDMFDAVLIEREAARRAAAPIDLMTGALDDGSSLILFPEGTRNPGPQTLLPFKSGLYHLALRRPEVDLVPVWINNLNRVLPKGEFVPVPLLCTVTFGEPMHLLDGEPKAAFLARTEAALLALSPKSGTAGP